MSLLKRLPVSAPLFVLLLPAPAPSADFLGKSVAVWARALDSNKAEVRRSAAFALGKIGAGADSELPKLAALVQSDRDAGVREAAAAAIGDVVMATKGSAGARWSATWPALRTALADGSPRIKRSAAYAIGAFGPDAKEAAPELKTALRDFSKGAQVVRQNAAWALGRIGKAAGDDTVDLLCERLGDEDPLVRRDAATALGEIGLPTAGRAWKPLLDLVRSESAKRDAADDVLLRTALANLTILLDNQNRQIIDAVMPLLNGNNAEEVRSKLRPAINGVLQNLGGIGLPDARAAREAALDRYRARLQEGSLQPVLDALKALEDLGKEENRKLATQFDPLSQLLRNEDPETAMLAAFALARVGGPTAKSAVPVLIRTLTDPDPKLQEQAATFLGELGPDAAEAVPALAAAVQQDRAVPVRARAAVALTKVGADAVRATPQLLEALRSTDTPQTQEHQVRKLVAEVFLQMGYPNSREAMPHLLDFIAKDANVALRQRCVDVFIFMDAADFPKIRSASGRSAEEVLTAVLSDPTLETAVMVKYDAARALAYNLREKAPDKAADMLLHMLTNEKLMIYKGTDATVTSVGSEGTSGATQQNQRLEGDARFMAAQALGVMGSKAKRRDVIDALNKAANDDKDKTGRLQTEAKKALSLIGG
jgi:HEAT repeat protein